jgi:hypothetical protein
MRTTPLFMLARISVLCLAAVLLTACDGGMSGTYEGQLTGGLMEGVMTLEFLEENKVKLVVAAGPMKLEHTLDYTIEGDTVTIKPPPADASDEPLVLTRKGNKLEGKNPDDGRTLTLTRK